MNKIILFISNRENEKLLTKELQANYQILISGTAKDIESQYDLGIIDGVNCEKMQRQIILRRYEEKPLFLPFLLVTTKKEIGLTTKHLWKVIDDIIITPIIKAELQARIAVLLRARYYSIQIKNRLDEMEIFSHAIGHDLQSPIRAIQHFSDYIRNDCFQFLNETCRDYCEHISQLAKRVNEINETIYKFLKIGKSGIKINRVILSQVVEKISEELSHEIKEKKAVVEIDGDIEFFADENLMKTIMRNLLQNAILYSKENVSPIIKISSQTIDSDILIKVTDNGIGIPEKDLEKVFDMFYRLHSLKTHRGSGLGLSIVKKCVEMMNGKVWVESKLNEGSSFFIRLPSKPIIYK
ncbi:MAG: HAMP domain-containing histidine kinase [Proteobacteria bacterium]|nr:HAMP domain-containing histidine kinase [Pseudomonadota bacterium]